MYRTDKPDINHDFILDDDGNMICIDFSDYQWKLYELFAWWVEGICLTSVAGIGLLANFIAITILCSKEFISKFSQLLICLAIIDNVFLGFSISDAVRRNFYERYVLSEKIVK